MKKAIILLSGGLDSATTCAIAKSKGFEIYSLSFLYGQRHKIEIESAKKVAKFFKVKEHKIAEIDLRIFGRSALTDDIAVPKNHTNTQLADKEVITKKFSVKENKISSEISSKNNSEKKAENTLIKFKNNSIDSLNFKQQNIPITYVPARNTIFLSYALAYAEVVGAFDIFIGVNSVDYSGYPDCRAEFIASFEKLANLATAVEQKENHKFKIHTPLISLSKKEIIATGLSMDVDYSITHSCYDPKIINKKTYACGECDSCLIRLDGFKSAGKKDPIPYFKN